MIDEGGRMGVHVLFSLIEKLPYDQDGNLLFSVKGREGDIYGGGHIYPDLSGLPVDKSYKKEGLYLVEFNISEDDAKTLVARQDQGRKTISHKTRNVRGKIKHYPRAEVSYNFQDFKPRILSAQEAEALKRDFFGVVQEMKSGVTD